MEQNRPVYGSGVLPLKRQVLAAEAYEKIKYPNQGGVCLRL